MADRLRAHFDQVDVVLRAYEAAALSINGAGDHEIVAPSDVEIGLLLQYLCISADAANGAAVKAEVRFGAAGEPIYILSLIPGAIWARNVGAGKRCLEGPRGEPLMVNLDNAQLVHVSAEYEEF